VRVGEQFFNKRENRRKKKEKAREWENCQTQTQRGKPGVGGGVTKAEEIAVYCRGVFVGERKRIEPQPAVGSIKEKVKI